MRMFGFGVVRKPLALFRIYGGGGVEGMCVTLRLLEHYNVKFGPVVIFC